MPLLVTKRNCQLTMVIDLHNHVHDISGVADALVNAKVAGMNSISSFFAAADDVSTSVQQTAEAVSPYTKVDKTGFIGFWADIIEKGIDLGHTTLQATGLKATYGISIILFTLLIKALTLPLTTAQLESTTKMQKLQPLQAQIAAKYANDEQVKNQLLAQLFQTANVNPLAGCLPAIVQIPVFLSLYRAIQNLVAENKLDEPFLWIPDLEGPAYGAPPGQSLDWVKSIFTGTPSLGVHDTIAFLSLPLILYVSQTVSIKVLQPPKDPNKVPTEQEQINQGIVNNLPFIVAFFSLNVPAGLGLYWIVNNIVTTVISLAVKNQFKDEQLSTEVLEMMASLDADKTSAKPKMRSMASAVQELRTAKEDKSRATGGFGSKVVFDAEVVSSPESSPAAADASNGASIDDSGDDVEDKAETDAGTAADGIEESRNKKKKRTKANRRN